MLWVKHNTHTKFNNLSHSSWSVSNLYKIIVHLSSYGGYIWNTVVQSSFCDTQLLMYLQIRLHIKNEAKITTIVFDYNINRIHRPHFSYICIMLREYREWWRTCLKYHKDVYNNMLEVRWYFCLNRLNLEYMESIWENISILNGCFRKKKI